MSGVDRDSSESLPALTEDDPPVQAAPSASGGSTRIGVRCAGRTAVGQVRDHNEDNFVVANLENGEVRPRDKACDEEVGESGLIFAVCDGMGGAAAGEVASQMAVDLLVEAMQRGGPPKNRDGLARRLVGAVEEAGRRIFESAQKERSRRGMGTTATVAVLVDKVLFLAEVGDSRAYLLRRGQLKQLTKDQSLVNQLIEAGHLTEDEAEAFEHSNIILQALGTSESVQVDLTFVELRRGDRLMMCSDGLSGLVHADTLRTTLDQIKDPADCCAKLIEYAEAAGGHDNITVVVADFDGEALSEAFEGDAFGYVQYPLPLSDGDSSAFVEEDTTGPGIRHHHQRDDDRHDEEDDDLSEQDREESLLPLGADVGDSRANLLWIAGGVLALGLGLTVWYTLEPAPSDDGQAAHSVEPARTKHDVKPDNPATTTASPEGATAEDIDVTVHTDVEKATLLVNGEAKGELSPDGSQSLKLKPGVYKFEAQSAGNPVAQTTVTVRGDAPIDVFLELPKGASEQAASPTGAPGKNGASDKPSPGEKPEGSAAPKPDSAEAAHTESPRPKRRHVTPTAEATSESPAAKPEAAPHEKTAPAAPAGEASAQRNPGAAPAQKATPLPDNPF